MACDRARAILGGMSKAAKNYVIRGKDSVMSGSNGVSRRLLRGLCAFAPLRLYEIRRLNEWTHFSQRRKGDGF